ncbi:MAG: NAD-dependent epimerase/dehydratase family protein [Intrasporangium sp.]|uniref:NAD-dependent epimerase/dehydratase family protein n=1 Tax=Intrasporangium sp. TaxID=1925024 RepID=UPI00264A14A8|nr:NAD-dependent epimerase/dehydratase family protein [Intrasporangium sp.]MDN5794688.1 NAD-dependent epimerase/dehydratase family protein [Intrasporangium sp.]
MARVLVLGGTSWLGGAVARVAVDDGHDVTCLARGVSGSVPDGARLVPGDRDDVGVYAAELGPGEWDLVVDLARAPVHARGAVQALADAASRWVLVSSISAYARHDEPGADESAGLLPALRADMATPEEYGEGKVACEVAVRSVRGPDALIVRAGLIVGAGDRSDRFGYWPGRFALAARDGGPVLVPARRDRPVQWVHVGDLASWVVSAGLRGITGARNALGPTIPLSDVLDACAAVAGFTGELVPVSDDALRSAGVEEFMGPHSLPLWLADPEWCAFMDRSGVAAVRDGLIHRPLSDVVEDAAAWEAQLGLDRARGGAGLDRAEELAIVARLR